MTQHLIGGPFFEDFTKGEILEAPPSVTITAGHAALHTAMFADRLRLPLDAHLSEKITSVPAALVNPSLLCNAAIGQTTYASQRVKANLFYRGLVVKNPVHVGDTLYTETKVVALKQNKAKPGRAATGLVALEMTVTNQNGGEVMKFWRCPMIPCRDKEAVTGHADNFDAMPESLDMQAVADAIPAKWELAAWRESFSGAHFDDIVIGDEYIVDSRDTVTLAPELVRLTLNMAVAHTDAGRSVYNKRLVYGGHTISMAAAQLVRAFPNMLTIMAWHGCDHTGPVFEEDILRSEVTVTGKHDAENGGLLDLQVKVYAERGVHAPEPGKDILVLDWRPVVLMA